MKEEVLALVVSVGRESGWRGELEFPGMCPVGPALLPRRWGLGTISSPDCSSHCHATLGLSWGTDMMHQGVMWSVRLSLL